ncbi:TolC family protein [Microaerobacter geothermalis]|uniref:TolC family protein n=1 Tax=Microaerobacter geothermalis TaxID=674972 RepID=UPI001F47CD1B|nr:TolC family protein [Microaerobacter geothermalis]MCF6093385.1 TolC family protein [Microaerobacter geothermalis]
MLQKKYKASFIILVAMLIVSTTGIVGFANNDSAPKEPVATFSLAEAIQIANNESLILNKLVFDIELAKSKLDDAEKLEDMEIEDIVMFVIGSQTSTPSAVSEAKIQKTVGLKLAKDGVYLAEKNYEFNKLKTKKETEDAYFTFLEAQEGLVIAQENVKRAQRALEYTNVQFEQGLVAKSAVLDSEVLVEQAKMGLIGAETQLKLAKKTLNDKLGRKLNEELKVEQVSLDGLPNSLNVEELEEKALLNRPDYLATVKTAESEKMKYDIYKNIYVSEQNSKVKEQNYTYLKAELDKQAKEREIRLQVNQAVEGYLTSKAKLSMLEKSVEKAKESLRLAELRYQNGMGTNLEVQSARVGLYQAELDLSKGKYDILRAKSALENAIGTTLE